jgi:hypothetical protein
LIKRERIKSTKQDFFFYIGHSWWMYKCR